MRVDVTAFQKLTGYSKRTVERAIATARDDMENDLIFRSCYFNQRWQLLCSNVQRLDGLNISEPFESDGKKSASSKSIGLKNSHPSARSWSTKEFYGVTESPEEEVEEVTEAPADPNQLEFVWDSKQAPWHERLEDSKANGASLEEQKEVAKCYANFLGLKALFADRQKCQQPLLNKGFPIRKNKEASKASQFQ